MSETQTVLEASAVAITQKVTYSAGATSFFAFLAKVDVIAWGGLSVAVIGLIIQFYFSIQRNKREQTEHEMRKAEYEQRMQNLKREVKREAD
ncbi:MULTISPECIES: holin [unclassified Acinetobacter]|uniref:holin n=1 Tax=unclassified Acinetobacter TaxID=196816 RepID=UPI000DD024EE|nr:MULTISPECIES: holin [unclassified Acinetobacter]